jgi:hypothetical protein
LIRKFRDVDVVVTLGREARVDPVPDTRFECWDTDEPSERGIDGIERMRLVRDDIAARVADLLDRMQVRRGDGLVRAFVSDRPIWRSINCRESDDIRGSSCRRWHGDMMDSTEQR